MPQQTLRVTDPNTGRTALVTVQEGQPPPSPQELERIFAAAPGPVSAPPQVGQQQPPDTIGQGIREETIDPLLQIGSSLVRTFNPFTGFGREAAADRAAAAGELASIPAGIARGIGQQVGGGLGRLGTAIGGGTGPTTQLAPGVAERAAADPNIPDAPEQQGLGSRVAQGAAGAAQAGLGVAGLLPGPGGVLGRLGRAVAGLEAGQPIGTAAEGQPSRALGQAIGIGAPLAVGPVGRSLQRRAAAPPRAITLPEGRQIPIPQTRGEMGSRVSGAFEDIARGSVLARGPLERFDINRVNTLVDDVAKGIADDISRFDEGPVQAGVELQQRLETAKEQMKSQAGLGLDQADELVAREAVIPSRTRQFAREEIQGIRDQATNRQQGLSPADAQTIAELERFANLRADEAGNFIPDMRAAREAGRRAPSELGGVAAGRAKKLASEMNKDLNESLDRFADPEVAAFWRRKNKQFADFAEAVENRTVTNLLKADPQKVPDLLARVDVRDIPSIRQAVGQETFQAAARSLWENTFLRAMEGERLSPQSPLQRGVGDAQSFFERQVSRGVRERTLKQRFESLAEGGRFDAIFGKDVARSTTELIGALEQAAAAQRTGPASLIARAMDAAVLFAPFRFTPPFLSGSALLTLNVAARMAAKPKGRRFLTGFMRTLDTPAKNAFWAARLGEMMADDEEIAAMIQQAGSEGQGAPVQ